MTAARLASVPSPRPTPARPSSRTPSKTMNARRIVTIGALSASVAVFVVAMLTSAASLYEIAVAEHLAAPWGLPVVLDLLATASAAVAWVTRSWGARLAAAGAFATSLGLQVSHVYAQGPTAWITHSAAPVSAVLMFEVALILAARHSDTGHLEVDVELEVAPLGADEPVVALATVTPAVRRPAAPKPNPSKPVAGPLEPDPEVVVKVAKALAEMGVDATEAKRDGDDGVLAYMRKRNGSAPHAKKVGAALRHLKEQS
jgi:hypothetical protein